MDFKKVASFEPREIAHSYTQRDTILYALGVGVGAAEPEGSEARSFAFSETALKALPTMAAVLAVPGFYLREPQFGVTWQKILHGEQSIQLHRPLPAAANVRGVLTLDDVYDRGPELGAVVLSRREIYDAGSGDHFATVRITSLLRGDGGQGGRSDPPPAPHRLPERAPDKTVTFRTGGDQALLYRLSGDYNPLHVDPAVAVQAGFSRPILHGLCTYGVCGRALLQAFCPDTPEKLTRIDARFSSPVFAGEIIRTEMWRDADMISFRAVAEERDIVVLNNGRAELAAVAADQRIQRKEVL